MSSVAEMRKIAKARLEEAEVLYAGNRHEAAIYISGYAVEIALKARVCRTLRWPGFPETAKEFHGLASFKTHDLEMLLRLCGREDRIKKVCLHEWSIAVQWNPESRYAVTGTATQAEAREMIEAVRMVLRKI